jgi:hypothetical protein
MRPLLLRVGTLWRCGEGLFFDVLPLGSDTFLTTLHPLLENVLQTVCRKLQEDSGTVHQRVLLVCARGIPSVILVLHTSKGKGKVKLSLCLTKHHAMKTYWGVEVQLHAFLTSALDGGEWSASRPGRFTPREKAPFTHWIGGSVGPRADLDAVVKRKISSPGR